jgi:hypothetical protein
MSSQSFDALPVNNLGVVEKTLAIPYPEHLPQTTGYFCGPASCQTALQVVLDGTVLEETQLAAEMHTTEDGTNSIELLADCLNTHAHHASWQAVWLPNDPPTSGEAEQFWVDLKANIDSGFPMPANWVSPEGNHPVALSGPSPGYYGTVYHYVCYVGYGEDNGQRIVHVAESGFSPWQYAVSFEQACSLMPPKGYVKAAAAAPGVPTLPGPAPEQAATCLTGRPHHHSENAPTDQQVLDIRAEGLITQALVYAMAEKMGLDARGIYDGVKNSF